MKNILLILALMLLATPVYASTAQPSQMGYNAIVGGQSVFKQYGPTLPFSAAPTTGTAAYSAVTVGVAASTILAASTATAFLDLRNSSNTATVCCSMIGTATISGTQCAAGEIALPPLARQQYPEGGFLPTDAVSCIASAASTQFTLGVK